MNIKQIQIKSFRLAVVGVTLANLALPLVRANEVDSSSPANDQTMAVAPSAASPEVSANIVTPPANEVQTLAPDPSQATTEVPAESSFEAGLPGNNAGERSLEATPNPSQKILNLQLIPANNQLQVIQAGQVVKLSFRLRNTGNVSLSGIHISPKLSTELQKWPFVIEDKSYGIDLGSLAPGQESQVTYQVKAREDLPNGKLPLTFKLAFDWNGERQEVERGLNIQTQAKNRNANGANLPPTSGNDTNETPTTGVINAGFDKPITTSETESASDNSEESSAETDVSEDEAGETSESSAESETDTESSESKEESQADESASASETPTSSQDTDNEVKNPPADESGVKDVDPYIGGGFIGDDGGSFSNGAVISGGEVASSSSVPRVIVTGFITNPKEVRAGSDFSVTINMRNTSSKTAVRNMIIGITSPTEGKDDNTGPAFLPVSGSNTLYVDSIPAGGESQITLAMNAKKDLVQKPYAIDMAIKYEDQNATQYETASSISLPIRQDARFEIANVQINPEEIIQGEEGNITANIYNLGRIKLYNTKARVEGKGISGNEVFLGNIDSGATAMIDLMVKASEATTGPAKGQIVFVYEDSDGEIIETRQDFQYSISEAMTEENFEDYAEEGEEEVAEIPIIPYSLSAIGIFSLVGVAWSLIKRKFAKGGEDHELD